MISVLIPVYNNEKTIVILVENLKHTLSAQNTPFEILLIDDASEPPVEKLVKSSDQIKIYRHIKNFGQVPAIFTGLNKVEGDACIIISADLQESLQVIPTMIQQWKAGSDLVIAERKSREFNAFSHIFYSLINFFYPKSLPQKGYDFGLLSRSLINSIKNINPYSSFLQILLLQKSRKTSFVHYERIASKTNSSWRLKDKIIYASLAFYQLDSKFYYKTSLLLIALITAAIPFSFIAFCLFLSILLVITIVVQLQIHQLSLKEKPTIYEPLS